MATRIAYDTLCDKLELYVAPTVDFISEEESKNKAAEEATDNAWGDEFTPPDSRTLRIFLPPDPRALRIVRHKVCTEFIANAWSETLRRLYKERGEIELRDCLLPEEIGGASSAWNFELSRFGFNHKQVENILRSFGQQEIMDSIELPWGGYVIRVVDGFKLSGSYNRNI